MVRATIKTCLCGDSITYIYEALLGGGGYACPPSEFQILSCRSFGRSLRRCTVGISSTAAPEIRRTSYILLPCQSFETLVCPIRPTLGRFFLVRNIFIFQNIILHCLKSPLSNS